METLSSTKSPEKHELLLIALTFVSIVLLNVTSINHSLGVGILFFLCFFSLRSPLSAMIALSASQISADPAGVPLTLMQCLSLGWMFQYIFVRRVDYTALRKLLVWTIPYLIFAKILNYIKWDSFQLVDNFDLAIMVGVIAAWYCGQLRGRYFYAYCCIGLGASVAVIIYWLKAIGVTVEGISIVKGGGLAESIGLGRGDGNFAGVSISLAASVALAIAMLLDRKYLKSRKQEVLIRSCCIVFFILSIPAIFATMSRGAVATFAGGMIFIFATAFIVNNLSKRLIFLAAIACVTIGAVIIFDIGSLMTKYAGSIIALSEVQMRESVLMSRENTWSAAFQELISSPLVGTTPDTRISLASYGFDYASHNVWLDVGRGVGIGGVLWFTAFFLYPINTLRRYVGSADLYIYATPFVVLFFVFMNLSLVNYKVFYIYWVLVVSFAYEIHRQRVQNFK